ncbi:MAG TPA: glycosyl transferase family 90 [Xanthobacteraceae bacterium]|nr:glycosyl transferase family 90 [Xanthobacteraceae bacterium]
MAIELSDFTTKIARVDFYTRGVIRDLVPYSYFQRALERTFAKIDEQSLDAETIDRVNYYNRLTQRFEISSDATPISSLRANPASFYYYDLKQFAKWFGAAARIHYKFGDLTHVPDQPSIVKSRPVGINNQNSVLLKLNKFRHYRWSADTTNFRQKKARAVWRGSPNNPLRLALAARYGSDPGHDIGLIKASDTGIQAKPYLPIREQLKSKYIISIEGYDVASNTKWIMASQSLCLMPAPKYETWFMEGRLVPGVHYVELRRDFEDLDEKIDYYERHAGAAEAIISNANRHVERFRNKRRENLISLLVLQKYFELSGQCDRRPFSRLIW